jgi:di/tricarboxylate transporter
MTVEIGLVFFIILALIVFFAFEIVPMDKIAFCLIGVLTLSGLTTPEEAISGFSNQAVITILCLMIIAAALEQNGVISWMASGLKRFRNWNIMLILPVVMFITGSISAFISSTAVVIVFIKIITELHDKFNISKSKLLLPISYACILGGSCTLMGTSTNLLVDSITSNRIGQQFSFFEFSWLGVQFFVVAILIVTLLYRVLPKDSRKKLKEQYNLDSYIMTLEVAPHSSMVGKTIRSSFLHGQKNISLLKLFRSGAEQYPLSGEFRFESGDKLVLSCDLENLLRFKNNREFTIRPDAKVESISPYEFKDIKNRQEQQEQPIVERPKILVELMMLPGARFLGNTLRDLRQSLSGEAIPIAIKKRKNLRYFRDRLYKNEAELTRLKVGDRVLVEINQAGIRDFDLYDNIAVLQQYEAPELERSSKRNISLIVLAGVVVLASTGLLSILASSITGSVVLLLFNCISLQNAYKKINWTIIFLLAGMIPLGLAMHNTGADDLMASGLLGMMYGKDPLFSLGLLFLTTMLISSVVSNNATAIIMTPVAISLALNMQLPIKPYVLAVMFASNFSFFTPVGYQTNSLIYSIGIYTFRHFLIVGGIISIVLWLMATFLLNTMIP